MGTPGSRRLDHDPDSKGRAGEATCYRRLRSDECVDRAGSYGAETGAVAGDAEGPTGYGKRLLEKYRLTLKLDPGTCSRAAGNSAVKPRQP